MKFLLAVLFLAFVAVAGWQQPFSEHYDRLSGQPQSQAQAKKVHPALVSRRFASMPRETPAPRDRSWMFEPTIMDRKPSHK